MCKCKMLIALAAFAIGLSGLVGTGTGAAAAQETPIPGTIHTGDCGSVGVVVASLSDASTSTGQPIGNDDAVPATSSFSTIPLSLDMLYSSDHVILIPHPSQDRTLACGEIGGFVGGDGALVLGLRAKDGSGVTGIAYLSPSADPSLTNVSLFFAGESLATLGNGPTIDGVGNADTEATSDATTESIADTSALQSADDSAVTSVDIQPYVDEVVRITDVMATSFDDLASLFENPQFGNDTWTINVATQFAIWRISYEEALQLSPPPGFEEVHSLFLEALRLYSEASYDAAEGLDTFDIDQINLAAEKMLQASELLDEAAALIRAMDP